MLPGAGGPGDGGRAPARDAANLGLAGEAHGKGRMGSALMGSLQISCVLTE